MPIMPAAPLPPAAPQAAPQTLPAVQKVTPIEPAKQVTSNKESGGTGLDAQQEKRRRRKSDRGRGGLYDLEV